MAYAQLQYRPHVKPTEQVQALIAPGHCWHFDAWLYDAGNTQRAGYLYLVTESRAGGRDLLSRNCYVWDGEGLRYCAHVPGDLRPVTINDKALWPREAELNRLHARVLEMASRVPGGFRSRSVALHYVRAPSIAPFDPDVVNLHQYGTN
jgi:hypothetical protein